MRAKMAVGGSNTRRDSQGAAFQNLFISWSPFYWREEVDQVAVGIAEQHRAAAPWLVGRFQYKFSDQFVEAEALFIDVRHLKIENHRVIGGWLRRSGIENVDAAFARNGQSASRNSQLHVVIAADRRDSQDLFVESRQRRDVFCNKSCLS